jgi:SAM-dependent methyltransferase
VVSVDPDDVREEWADRSGAYSPEYYAHHGPDQRSEAVLAALGDRVGSDAAILELGCSAGRHLAHLYENGFEKLTGVDVNRDAFDVLEETYPELAAVGTFHETTIEAAADRFADGQFDVVYSVEALQHVHPDSEWVFAELARIAGELVITVENEDGNGGSAEADADGGADPEATVVDEVPLYFRDWERHFTTAGMEQIESRLVGRNTLRVFRQPAE